MTSPTSSIIEAQAITNVSRLPEDHAGHQWALQAVGNYGNLEFPADETTIGCPKWLLRSVDSQGNEAYAKPIPLT